MCTIQVAPLYSRYVHLKNKLAGLRGYEDLGDMWRRDDYEVEDFEVGLQNPDMKVL